MRCPRCGLEGRLEKYYVNGRAYYRVVHGSGKSRTRCYLGPADDYLHAAPILWLRLRNLAEIDYAAVVQDAIDTLLSLASRYGMGEEAAEWLARVRRLREALERELLRVEAVERELERLARAAGASLSSNRGELATG